MGMLAMVDGSVHSLQQLHTITQICSMDHSNLFLMFMEKMVILSNEYIHLPWTPANLFENMKHYEEVGPPGAIRLVVLCTCGGQTVLLMTSISQRVRNPIHCLYFSALLTSTVRFLEYLVHNLEFGSQNDKHIMKLDPNVCQNSEGWVSEVK